MSNVSQFLSSTSPKAIQLAGPGSNGYWRREMWLSAGAYTFTVKKTGKHKIYALGAGGGANATAPGAGGGLSCWEGNLVANDVVTVTVGAGGTLNNSANTAGNGGTTTVVCAARSLSMTANGGQGATDGVARSGGTSSGGNVFNYTGGGVQASGYQLGGSSSASPDGNGLTPAVTSLVKNGGLGWCRQDFTGSGNTYGGGSRYQQVPTNGYHGANGKSARGGVSVSGNTLIGTVHGELLPFWDLNDIDGGGGAASTGTGVSAGHGGPGAGGGSASSSAPGGNGGFGGGGGNGGAGAPGGRGGNGGGGGVGPSSWGGSGGDGAVLIFWDEVA